MPRDALLEAADRIWVARHAHLDVNAGIIRGERGLVVVDTLWSADSAQALLAEVRALGLTDPVIAVVNTHDHYDHVLGNEAIDAPVIAHEDAASVMAAMEPPIGVDRTFSSVATIDLGDRFVEVLHPGRGHTAGDAVVRVQGGSDDAVLFTGDLVEQGAAPSYGEDSFPLEWPISLDFLETLIGPGSVVVPGHGDLVDKEYVGQQRAEIGVVAETIRDLASRGVPVDQALASASWPFPAESLAHAVRLGYAHLPRSARSLPLL